MSMHIRVAGVFVDDQDRAAKFYTEVLGFEIRQDVPAGEYRWLTVGEKGQTDGLELLLEPNAHPAAQAYQQAIYADGIPATMFFVDDLESEMERLKALGVEFEGEPVDVGTAILAIFDDTCGNLIQICQVK